MRQDFDGNVPEAEQRLRLAWKKTKGRKHQHKPSSRVNERRKAARMRSANMRSVIAERFKAKVRAYWSGDAEEYPS